MLNIKFFTQCQYTSYFVIRPFNIFEHENASIVNAKRCSSRESYQKTSIKCLKLLLIIKLKKIIYFHVVIYSKINNRKYL